MVTHDQLTYNMLTDTVFGKLEKRFKSGTSFLSVWFLGHENFKV
jgi:hypothetical protein